MMKTKSWSTAVLAAWLSVSGFAGGFVHAEDDAAAAISNAGAAEAREAYHKAQAVIDRGSLGFFEYVRDKQDSHMLDAQGAINKFGDGILDDWTNMGDENDATSLEHMKATLPLLAEGNALRAQHGAPALKVTLALTAVEQKQLNWSDTNMDHALKYGNSVGDAWIGDNLAWGPSSPYSGWYTKEKEVYEKYLAQGLTDEQIRKDHWLETGHYLTLINPDYRSTGFAVNSNEKWTKACGQAFNRVDTGYSVEEYTALFNEYYDKVQADLKAARQRLQSTGVVMYRLYNPNSGEHFYTGDRNEYDTLKQIGWKDENVGWIAPQTSSTPVYRLYNPNAGDHHYTMDADERTALVKIGWKDEGIGWYSDDDKLTALYRQYNPQAQAGSHNYTSDENEAITLIFSGWKDEGIAWYGL